MDADTLDGNPPEYFVTKQEIRNLEVDSVTIGTVQVAPIPNGNILCKKCGFLRMDGEPKACIRIWVDFSMAEWDYKRRYKS